MLQIDNKKYKQSALEDIANLQNNTPQINDNVSDKMYFMIWHTRTYIIKKFNLSNEEVRKYLEEHKRK